LALALALTLAHAIHALAAFASALSATLPITLTTALP
jgi:hypothetical protein